MAKRQLQGTVPIAELELCPKLLGRRHGQARGRTFFRAQLKEVPLREEVIAEPMHAGASGKFDDMSTGTGNRGSKSRGVK